MHAYPQAQWLDVAGDTTNRQQLSRCTAQLEVISFVKFCFMQTRSAVISLVFRAFLCTEKIISLLACSVPGMQQGMLMKTICPLPSLQVAELTFLIRFY